jgi:hypothetical protein
VRKVQGCSSSLQWQANLSQFSRFSVIIEMIGKVIGIFRNEKAVPFLSFLIGLGITIMLFHRPIPVRQALSVPAGEIEGRVVRHGDKCIKYVAEDAECELPSFK